MDIICVDGYKAFRGIMQITPKNPNIKPIELSGEWLYKPDTKCWYGNNGYSYPEEICSPK